MSLMADVVAKIADAKIEKLEAENKRLQAEARFLLDRLREYENDGCTERDFYGHVAPSMARLEALCTLSFVASN